MPNRPGLHITRHCDAKFDPGATCPRFLQFLPEIFGGDQATIDAVQLLFGYTLTGLTTEEIIIFCVGFGANGKSILGNVANTVVGEYVLRNQLIHGSATWNSKVNRSQVKDGAAVLGVLLPVFINIMMDNPDHDWGKPYYPVVE
jgi:hypothetical protein